MIEVDLDIRGGLVSTLPRYERPREEDGSGAGAPISRVVAYEAAEATIAGSSLSDGSKRLLRGLLRLGATRVFPGGGVGIDYGSLLKTAARPEYVAVHVAEAAAHLRDRRVDFLLVPGMSGYPIGSMYALAASTPAVLLKKAKLDECGQAIYPPGSFVIPSYTGDGDVVMHADPVAVQDIVDTILEAQLRAQRDVASPELVLLAAGADDIIDKATMSQAAGESALVLGRAAIADFLRRHRADTGDSRPISSRVEVVACVTPLIKGYNRPHEHLRRTFGIRPFAGLNVTSVRFDPPALGIEGVGVLALNPHDRAGLGGDSQT